MQVPPTSAPTLPPSKKRKVAASTSLPAPEPRKGTKTINALHNRYVPFTSDGLSLAFSPPDSADSQEVAASFLQWLIAPLSTESFYAGYFERRPFALLRSHAATTGKVKFVTTRSTLPALLKARLASPSVPSTQETVDALEEEIDDTPVLPSASSAASSSSSSPLHYYSGWFSKADILSLAASPSSSLHYTRDVDVTSYRDGQRSTLNPPHSPPVTLSSLTSFLSRGCSVRFLSPQSHHPPLQRLLHLLDQGIGLQCGANSYLTPRGTQGFSPHYDDVDVFILQTEGRKRWRLYEPLDESQLLPLTSSPNFTQAQLGRCVLDVWLHAGDFLYAPRGTVHQCFGTDSRVLTNHGLLFLDQLQALISNGAEVKYAAYDKASQTLQYVTGTLRVNAADSNGRLVSFADPSEQERFAHPGPLKPTRQDTHCNYTSIRVTPDHDMFVQQAVGSSRMRVDHPPHAKMKAGRLLAGGRAVRFMASAARGVRPPFCSFTLADVLRCTLGLQPHHIDPFLELYGFWLGDGTMSYNTTLLGHIRRHGSRDSVQFSQKNVGDNEFLHAQFAACGLSARDWRSSQTDDGREILQVTRRAWFEYFDESYGSKYRHSSHYDKRGALVEQGMRRRPPAVAASAAVSMQPPCSPRATSMSAACSPHAVSTGASSSPPSTTRPLRESSVMDLTDDDVKVDDTGAVAPLPSQRASSPHSTATTAQSATSTPTSRSRALSLSSSGSSAIGDIPDPPLFCWQCGGDEWIGWDVEMGSWQCWRCACPADEEMDDPTMKDEEPPIDDDTPMRESTPPPPVDVPSEKQPPTEEKPPTDDEEDDPVKSVKWLLWWVLQLCTPAQCRLILRGVQRADGQWAAQETCISTSGVQFREELVQLALHAGYSAYFTCDYEVGDIRGYHKLNLKRPRGRKRGRKYERGIFNSSDITPATAHLFVPIVAHHDHWRVHYTDTRASHGTTWPSVNWDGDGIKEEPYTDVTWCVTVDHADHLIVAQRALRDEDGRVYKASKPLIIGQCVASEEEDSLHVTVSSCLHASWGDYLAALLQRAVERAKAGDAVFRRVLPRHFHRYMGAQHADRDDDRREAFMDQTLQLIERLLTSDETPFDAAADEMALDYMHGRIQPVLLPAQQARSRVGRPEFRLQATTLVRTLEAGLMRLTASSEEGSVRVHHLADNEKGYKEAPLGSIDVDEALAGAVEAIIDVYPQWVQVRELPFGNDEEEGGEEEKGEEEDEEARVQELVHLCQALYDSGLVEASDDQSLRSSAAASEDDGQPHAGADDENGDWPQMEEEGKEGDAAEDEEGVEESEE